MRIVGQLALFDERGHLLRRQTVASADGGVEGHQKHQIVNRYAAEGWTIMAVPPWDVPPAVALRAVEYRAWERPLLYKMAWQVSVGTSLGPW